MKHILILEDDLETLSIILAMLARLEHETNVELSTIQLSEYGQVAYLNQQDLDLDLIILDHDCKLTGSFHILDIEKFGSGKVIAISTQPEYNAKAERRGVLHVVRKDYTNMATFAEQLGEEAKKMLNI